MSHTDYIKDLDKHRLLSLIELCKDKIETIEKEEKLPYFEVVVDHYTVSEHKTMARAVAALYKDIMEYTNPDKVRHCEIRKVHVPLSEYNEIFNVSP